MMSDASTTSAKRSRDVNGNALGSVTLDDVQSVVDKSLADQAKVTTSLVSKLMGELESGLAQSNEATSKVVMQSISSLGSRVTALEGQASAQQMQNQQVAKQLTEITEKQTRLEEQLRVANKNVVTKDDINSDVFDRPPNLSILRVNANRYVSKNAVHDALVFWFDEIKVPEDKWVLYGRAPQG